VAVTTYGESAVATGAVVQVAAPEVTGAVSPATHPSDSPEAPTIENVTVPVGVPAEAGVPMTTAVIVAEPPDGTTPDRRILILELALPTGWVTEADEAATPADPG
jgi:hypothetical protein